MNDIDDIAAELEHLGAGLQHLGRDLIRYRNSPDELENALEYVGLTAERVNDAHEALAHLLRGK